MTAYKSVFIAIASLCPISGVFPGNLESALQEFAVHCASALSLRMVPRDTANSLGTDKALSCALNVPSGRSEHP